MTKPFSDKSVGLTNKYKIERTDGKPMYPSFTFEYGKDPLAAVGLLAYAGMAFRYDYHNLGTDLQDISFKLIEDHAAEDFKWHAEAAQAFEFGFIHVMSYLSGGGFIERAGSVIKEMRDMLDMDEDHARAKLHAAYMAFVTTANDDDDDTGTHYLYGYDLVSKTHYKLDHDQVAAFFGFYPERLYQAAYDLVAECHEAIKSEEWDSDNAAWNAALQELACPMCEGEGERNGRPCLRCKNGVKLFHGYTAAIKR